MRLGTGYRRELDRWIRSSPPDLEFLEITAEHFFYGRGRDRLRELARKFPLCVHGLSLSLGTPGPLIRSHLLEFADVVRACNPLWISEHIALTRTPDRALGHLTPIRRDRETLNILRDHSLELRAACGGRPLLLENITDHLGGQADAIRETEFLNRLCDDAGTGLLIDVTNLAVNARNHGFDPYQWLDEIEPRHVLQLHVVGFSEHRGIALDCHSRDITGQTGLGRLITYALTRFRPKAVILERDENFPASGDLTAELATLAAYRTQGATEQLRIASS